MLFKAIKTSCHCQCLHGPLVEGTGVDSLGKLKDVLVSLVEEEDLHYDNAKTIADIFDILLTKRIEIEYNITASVTIDVPITADPDEVADEIYCERVEFSAYNSDYEVLESDYDVSDWNIRS
jgi:hypothetical protein